MKNLLIGLFFVCYSNTSYGQNINSTKDALNKVFSQKLHKELDYSYTPAIKNNLLSILTNESLTESFFKDYPQVVEESLLSDTKDLYLRPDLQNLNKGGVILIPLEFAIDTLSNPDWTAFRNSFVNKLVDLNLRVEKYKGLNPGHSSRSYENYQKLTRVDLFTLNGVAHSWRNFQVYHEFAEHIRDWDLRKDYIYKSQSRKIELVSLLLSKGLIDEFNRKHIASEIDYMFSDLKDMRNSGIEFGSANRLPYEFMFSDQLQKPFLDLRKTLLSPAPHKAKSCKKDLFQ